MGAGCNLVNKICICLTCGRGRFVVRFVHTLLSVGIPANLIFNKHSDLHEWLVLHQGKYIYGFMYLGLLLASLIFYYCACLTDPGYVDESVLNELANEMEDGEVDLFTRKRGGKEYSPVHTSDPSTEEINELAANDIELQQANHNSSNSNAVSSLDRETGPGALERKDKSTDDNDKDIIRMCKVCKTPQPLRSRHCEDCKKCVLKFDHHCPWLATCVGEKNHKFFLLFLLFINAVIIFSAVIAVRGFPAHSYKEKEFSPGDVGLVLLVILDCIILFIGGISTISLLAFHSYLMFTNQTTWENVSRTKISYLKKFGDDFNPFHLGYCCNVYTFCCKRKPKQWKLVYKRSSSSAHLLEDV